MCELPGFCDCFFRFLLCFLGGAVGLFGGKRCMEVIISLVLAHSHKLTERHAIFVVKFV